MPSLRYNSGLNNSFALLKAYVMPKAELQKTLKNGFLYGSIPTGRENLQSAG
jgi:hypothetical protein